MWSQDTCKNVSLGVQTERHLHISHNLILPIVCTVIVLSQHCQSGVQVGLFALYFFCPKTMGELWKENIATIGIALFEDQSYSILKNSAMSHTTLKK